MREETHHVDKEGPYEDGASAKLLGKWRPEDRANTVSGDEQGDGEGGHFV